jgi:RES domain-containing protein
MREIKTYTEERIRYEWHYFWEAAGQRKAIIDDLYSALRESSIGPFEEKNWQRAVTYKYSQDPLSVAGSLKSYPGGRFNIGNLDPNTFPPFPALYMASDQSTAIQELSCQDIPHESRLTNIDFALQKNAGFSVVPVSFCLDRVLDLRKLASLRKFVDLTKNFKISKDLKEMAKRLQLSLPAFAKEPIELRNIILEKDWRYSPMQNDVPANSQILGQLVMEAKIDGIVYPSKMTGKAAVAVFTRNFQLGDSWVELEGDLPTGVTRRIDLTNWKIIESASEKSHMQ